jgi:hypothetical protein
MPACTGQAGVRDSLAHVHGAVHSFAGIGDQLYWENMAWPARLDAVA